jgi:hypothetical protein
MDATGSKSGAGKGSPNSPQFLSARDFAETTGIPLRSLQRYLAQGLIPGAVRVGPGTKWRISPPTKDFGHIKDRPK